MNRRACLWAIVLGAAASVAPAGDAAAANPRRMVADGAQLLDVRSEEEFAAGHIDGAVNIPIDELAWRADELVKERAIVVYCKSGVRSAHAAKLLRKAGFKRVYDMGAMSRWWKTRSKRAHA